MTKKKYDFSASDEVPGLTSCRVTLALVGFLGTMTMYSMRVNMSIAIVCMVKEPFESPDNTTSNVTITPVTMGIYGYQEEECPNDNTKPGDGNKQTGEFEWSRQERGLVLSSFYWGYVLTQILGGWLAGRFGGKWVLFVGMLLLTIFTFLTPIAARGGLYLLLTLQILKGLSCGVYFPAMQAMWGCWAPPLERSKLSTFVSSGLALGTVICFSISGLLCDQTAFAGGWPAVFYTYGLFALVFLILWPILAFNSPADHPRITEAERHYIEESIGFSGDEEHTGNVPWCKIFKSPAIIAILFGFFADQWGGYTTLSVVPQYMSDILKFDIKQNGFFNALPQLCLWVSVFVSSQIVDLVRSKGVQTGLVRKVVQACGFLPPAVIALIIGYLTCHEASVAVALFCVASVFAAFSFPGVQTNTLDVAPRYAGVIMGICNTVGNFTGILVPLVAGALTPNGLAEEWRIVFFISGGVYLVGAIVFVLFGSGEEQPWARKAQSETKPDDIFAIGVSQKEQNEGKINQAFSMKETT